MSADNIIGYGGSMDAQHEQFVPNYSIDQAELACIEQDMIAYTEERQKHGGVHALLIDPSHPFSNFVRTQEEVAFPGASKELSLEVELDTRQLALVDTRKSSSSYGKVVLV